MKKATVLGAPTVLVVLLVGCASTGPTPYLQGHATTYMLLADGSVHRDGNPPAIGFYVLGTQSGREFAPSSGVLGTGAIGDGDGEPGWLELRDGTFHTDHSGRSPVPPFIRGLKDGKGVFHPGDDKISQ